MPDPNVKATTAEDPPQRQVYDVIVVGAGFAGLAAARQLTQAGRKVLVLEGRDRVGGRAFTVSGAGVQLDLGGQWIGPGQERIGALLREFNFRTYPQSERGRSIACWANGGRTEFTCLFTLLLSLPWPDNLKVAFSLLRFRWATCTVNWPLPFCDTTQRELEGQSLADWIARRTRSARARELLGITCRGIFCCEPREISAHFSFASIKACGGLTAVLAKSGGAQESRVEGGIQPLAIRLAAELGDRVRVSCPARQIRWSDGGVEVSTERGVFRARHAILTAPLPHGPEFIFSRSCRGRSGRSARGCRWGR
jgi:monoamine oxidase